MPCRAKSIKEKRLPDAGPLRYCTASESDGRIFSATHIRHASRPIASVPMSGRVVIYRLRGIPGRHRWRCVGRTWRHDNNGRSTSGRCDRSVAVSLSRVIVERGPVAIVTRVATIVAIGRVIETHLGRCCAG
jgi:hypothetical protein